MFKTTRSILKLDGSRLDSEAMPLITTAEVQELQERWEQVGTDVSLFKVLGQVSGVAVNKVQSVTDVLKAIGVDHDTRLTVLMARYEQEVTSGGWVALPELAEDAGAFAEWMSGLGNAVALDNTRLSLLTMFEGDELERTIMRNAFVIPGSFADRATLTRSIMRLSPAMEKQYALNRNRLLTRWEQTPVEEREDLARELLEGQQLAVPILDSLDLTAVPPTTVRRKGQRIGPNEPCPCGSGKKYKKCHGVPGAEALPGA